MHWIHASSAARFDEDVRAILVQLRAPQTQSAQGSNLQRLQNWLQNSKNGSWLVILDNADDAGFLLEPPATSEEARSSKRRIDYFPACDHGSMIVTSRSTGEALKSQLVYESDIIPISTMSEDEAIVLMSNKLDRSDEGIHELVRALDCLPLAITQAAAYICAQGKHFFAHQYLQRLEDQKSSLLREHIPLPDRDREASNSVLLTWRVSFEHINKIQQSAADLLALMSFCDRTSIPAFLIHVNEDEDDCELGQKSGREDRSEHGTGSQDGDNSQGRDDSPDEHNLQDDRSSECEGNASRGSHVERASSFERDIMTLRDYSFISETARPQVWEMHLLVQDATQVWLEDQGKRNNAHNRFIRQLDRCCPAMFDFEDWPLWRDIFPHAKHVLKQRPSEPIALLKWSRVMHDTSVFAAESLDHSSQLELAEASMKVLQEQHGQEHQSTLRSKVTIGGAYIFLGRWDEAERLLMKVLKTAHAALGAEDKTTTSAMAALAFLCYRQGRWAESEQLEIKVLETYKATIGPTHPFTLRSMAQLASTNSAQGRTSEAESLLLEMLDIALAFHGPKHQETLLCVDSLVKIYNKQECWSKAEELGLRLVETEMEVLGSTHPTTLAGVASLAFVHMHKGNLGKAEQLFLYVLDTSKEVLGSEHPTSLMYMFMMAAIFECQGRGVEAEEFMMQVVEGRKKVFGEEHPETLDAAASLEAFRLERNRCERSRWQRLKHGFSKLSKRRI